MSVLFGRWQFDGRAIDFEDLESLESQVAHFGPDERVLYRLPCLAFGYRAFHTTPDSDRAHQPYVGPAGIIVTFDGRLDNREELVSALGKQVLERATEVEIIAAAYAAWDVQCFQRFIGDWSMVLWDPRLERLLLARDFVGTRYLYYRVNSRSVLWSTILDPLVRDRDSTLSLSEAYLAGWLLGFPKPELTPFQGIQAVAPATYVSICNGQQATSKYWDFNPRKLIRYSSDQEYEEHFRTLFAQAVARRLVSNAPVLAELSGGMDSSSIVCMADRLVADGESLSRLNTLSYYSDSEPLWNDQNYFTIVERQRKQLGAHIQVTSNNTVELDNLGTDFPATPANLRQVSNAITQLSETVRLQGNRVLLSGVGGDEVLGGIPTPTPELADLLASGNLLRFCRQISAWSLAQRKPLLSLTKATIQELVPALAAAPRVPNWFSPRIRKQCEANNSVPATSFHLLRPHPSFEQNLCALEGLRGQLGCSALSRHPLFEKRYPYLDRDLLEFLYAIPRDQILRPGQRRSLMRRALIGIVPDEILNRTRKALAVRTTLNAMLAYWSKLSVDTTPMFCSSLGLIDHDQFVESMMSLRQQGGTSIFHVSRTLTLELWLRQLDKIGVLRDGAKTPIAPQFIDVANPN